MRDGNWKQTDVAVGCVLGRRHKISLEQQKLITTLLVFAVPKIPHPVAEQEEDSQEVCVFYDISYYKVYVTCLLRRKRKSVSLLLGHAI